MITALFMATFCIGVAAASGGNAGAASTSRANVPPRAGYYSGTTHRGREFSLRVTADHHVGTFKLNEQPLWPHLHLAMHDNGHGYRFHWEQGRQEISGGVHAPDYLRGAFYLGQDHFEHFDVFWRHS
ncbi:MAG TPA: hypothetical protein VMS11_11740 [Solirubrobacterales bacterium]|nr:hypothetical protein [Solirubrobacterales bacterium]